jgi:hypothetical protein
MFLRTLGLKTDGMISEFVKSKQKGTLQDIICDKRGKKVPKNKKDKGSIEDHIMSFNRQVT